MTDQKDLDIITQLEGLTPPAPADSAFLARLKTIPATHAQAIEPNASSVGSSGANRSWWRDLAPLFRPRQMAFQGGFMAAALVAGVWVGGLSRTDNGYEEIDLTDYAFISEWDELP